MKQPPLRTPDRLDVPMARRQTLRNGVELHTLPDDEFEVLRLSFVFRAGSAVQRVPFSASSTANLLSEGSRDMDAQQIAEKLDFYGSYYDVTVDRDYVYLSFCSLSKFFLPTLEVAERILLGPVFPEDEVDAYRRKRKQRLAIERLKVDTKAREALAQALFGERHPYGISYNEAAYDTLTREDLADMYRTHYTAGNCLAVCSGNITDAHLQAIVALAERLPRGGERLRSSFPDPVTQSRRFVHTPDAVQSSIRLGRLLFTREHPDFVPMQVVAAALGGYFGSRLLSNLRERNGYTYGVAAAMVNFERAGYFAVATQTGAEVTDAALREIYAEIERLRREPMPAEELQTVKNILIGEMMRVLDGPFGIADVTIENALCGMDNGVIGRNLQRILAIGPEQVRDLAARYLAPQDLTTVVAGPRKPEGF